MWSVCLLWPLRVPVHSQINHSRQLSPKKRGPPSAPLAAPGRALAPAAARGARRVTCSAHCSVSVTRSVPGVPPCRASPSVVARSASRRRPSRNAPAHRNREAVGRRVTLTSPGPCGASVCRASPSSASRRRPRQSASRNARRAGRGARRTPGTVESGGGWSEYYTEDAFERLRRQSQTASFDKDRRFY